MEEYTRSDVCGTSLVGEERRGRHEERGSLASEPVPLRACWSAHPSGGPCVNSCAHRTRRERGADRRARGDRRVARRVDGARAGDRESERWQAGRATRALISSVRSDFKANRANACISAYTISLRHPHAPHDLTTHCPFTFTYGRYAALSWTPNPMRRSPAPRSYLSKYKK